MVKAAAVRKSAPPPIRAIKPPAVEIFDEVEQGSEEWFALRLGLATASNFSTIMAEGENGENAATRKRLMYRLAGEILTGVPGETYRNKQMERGNEMEPKAREFYARTSFSKVRRIGFMRRKLPSGTYVGASPDGLVGDDHGVEIKTMMPELLIDVWDRGVFPTKHRAQCHGTMWVGGLKSIDLVLFYEGMPIAPKFALTRDEAYIKEISDAVERFEYELRMLVKRLRAAGGSPQ